MSLSNLEAEFAQFIVNAIEACGFPAPEKAIVHHATALPETCCPEDGVLSVWWYQSNDGIDVCGKLKWYLAARYSRCWITEDPIEGGGVNVDYAGRAEIATRLADLAECVANAILRDICKGASGEFYKFSFEPKLGQTTAQLPSGGCAAITWRIVAGVRHPNAET